VLKAVFAVSKSRKEIQHRGKRQNRRGQRRFAGRRADMIKMAATIGRK